MMWWLSTWRRDWDFCSFMPDVNLWNNMAQISRKLSFIYCIWECLFVLFPLNGITGQSLPQKPTGLMYWEVTAQTVKLTWKSGSTEALVQYRPKDEGGEQWIETRPKDSSFIVRRLQPFTVYEFRVVGVNENGRGEPSDILEVRTGELGLC